MTEFLLARIAEDEEAHLRRCRDTCKNGAVMTRQTYVCDECGDTEPNEGSLPEGWIWQAGSDLCDLCRVW